MTGTGSPTLRRRRLAVELRRLREAAGLTGVQVAKELRWSTSKVSRLETGQVVPQEGDVEKLLRYFNADSETSGRLLGLTRDAHRKGWWEKYAEDMPEQVITLAGLEDEAAEIRSWYANVVPGMLQTYGYASVINGLYQSLQALPSGKIERRTQFRLRRQELLTSGKLDYSTILDEAVLRRRYGSQEVMKEQLRWLLEVSDSPNVSIRVLPLDASHPADGSHFILMKFPEVPGLGTLYDELLYTEDFPVSSLAEDESVVYMYSILYGNLEKVALDQRQSKKLIASLAR
ncbi:helix-turn-helix domain-containing protein [Planobispora siamensis]|uniref:Transcriptional regulator n=1 Tax=Planobispora siamensis TaxID=936338 RepID=A0A8J3WHT2_9ACTN|nr:helix-turn-helix transcriptional regulator [Planobispora siamensis]GIH90964.1 transcriptional regulator [Planobispora siamensis]